MRTPRTLADLGSATTGDHVCQVLDRPDDVIGRSRTFIADAVAHGDKVVIVGPPLQAEQEFAPLFVDPGRLDGSLLAAVRREAANAGREGFRSLRVLHQARPGSRARRSDELLRSELDLEEFAADTGSLVVCAYSRAEWDASDLDRISCVHPHHVGSRSLTPTFRVYRTGKEGWVVDGIVDSDGAAAFGAILCTLLARRARLRLLAHALEFLDAAGMTALADAACSLPDRRIVLEGTNETVRLAWKLSGFGAPDVPVVIAP